MPTIYERMAKSQLISTSHRVEGARPHVKHVVRFGYANDLIVEHDGANWTVVQPEHNRPLYHTASEWVAA